MKIIIPSFLASLLMVCSVSSRAYELDLVATLVPVHSGLTVKKYPSVCLIFPNTPPPIGTTIFTLLDPAVTNSVLEVQLRSPNASEEHETCYCVNLEDYGFSLVPDVQYLWYLSIVQNSETRPKDIVANGMIERCSFDECVVIMDGPLGCSKDHVTILVEHGFWYDAAACLCDLISSNPDDEALRRSLYSLFRQGAPYLFPSQPGQQPY